MILLGCLQSPWDSSSLSKQFSYSDAAQSRNSWLEKSAVIPQEAWPVIWLLWKEIAGFISWAFSLLLQIHVLHVCLGRRGLLQQTEFQTMLQEWELILPRRQQYVAISRLATVERGLRLFWGKVNKVNSQVCKAWLTQLVHWLEQLNSACLFQAQVSV